MTSTTETPRFATDRGHPALRAGIILALCASLLAGFVVTASQPATSPGGDDARAVACSASGTQDAC